MKKVICTHNGGLEFEFDLGKEYQVARELDTTYIVINNFGNKHTVFKTQFEPFEEGKNEEQNTFIANPYYLGTKCLFLI
ncbi:hypothetical protein RCG23_00365 [Neobacillus sp. PS3-34]|uniref:hypothetical protein n=1 Tax=Neobacillus sp. PS3-34 TaxID=3070678 RepID=UPI0027E06876|nr:hypothetical protein [Neobacillus sp. PS3-34]WML48646.1 hypothetical protein RCG23_00365 [Neobacillus sp. PS3-34]